MTNRILGFYALAVFTVLIASFLQNRYYPAVPQGEEQDGTNAVATTDQPDVDGYVSTSPQDAATQLPNDETSAANAVADGAEAAAMPATEEPQEEAAKNLKKPAGKLYTVGSLANDSPFRYLITLDSAGGTVRRVELNYRKANGDYKYRDLEYLGGYLGELDCVDSEGRCVARVVGDGTPAFIAGLRAGDAINSIDGEPIVSADDFVRIIGKAKPGQTLQVAVTKGESSETPGAEASVEVLLTDKPIELIRPQPDILAKGWPAKPSFQTTLRNKSLADVWPELDKGMIAGNWKLEQLKAESISFSYSIANAGAAAGNGPVEITKTYTLPKLNAQEEDSEVKRDFHFDLTLGIKNQSDQPSELTYQLDGPLGTPSETWWYQNKIHGRSSAIGYTAGARDVTGSTGQEDFTFFGGPEIVANLRKSTPKYFWVLKPSEQEDSTDQQVKNLTVDTQYFNVGLIPEQTEAPFTAYSVLADVAVTDIPKEVREQKLVDCTFRMFKVLKLKPGEQYQQKFEIFAGPKEVELLTAYELEDVRSFGWFAMFSKPLVWLLGVFHKLIFGLGYGIPIILLTMVVRSLMIPISRKAALNAQMMQYLQPQMKELTAKYKDDMEKRGQAQRDLFKKYNYNPFGGCFMMFFQIPIFIGLYRGLSVDIALRDQPLFPGLGWCTNLSAPDQFWYWKDSLPSFLSFLTNETGWLGPYLNILPVLTCILFVVQTSMFTPPPTDEQQAMMQKVMKYAMVLMGFMFFKVPSGLCLYFITSSLWGIIERKMLPKPELDKSKLESLPDVDGGEDKASVIRRAKQESKKLQAEQKRREEQDEKKRRDKDRKRRLKERGV